MQRHKVHFLQYTRSVSNMLSGCHQRSRTPTKSNKGVRKKDRRLPLDHLEMGHPKNQIGYFSPIISTGTTLNRYILVRPIVFKMPIGLQIYYDNTCLRPKNCTASAFSVKTEDFHCFLSGVACLSGQSVKEKNVGEQNGGVMMRRRQKVSTKS